MKINMKIYDIIMKDPDDDLVDFKVDKSKDGKSIIDEDIFYKDLLEEYNRLGGNINVFEDYLKVYRKYNKE